MKMNVPNVLTIVRVVLVPAFFILFYRNRYIALVIFAVASFTDFLDGFLARRNHQITNFGKFMDPLADKLLVTTALMCLADAGVIPLYVPVIVVARDLAVDGLRMLAASSNIVVAASWFGKIKTSYTLFAICFLLVFGESVILKWVCAGGILLLNVISLIDYFRVNGHVLRDAT